MCISHCLNGALSAQGLTASLSISAFFVPSVMNLEKRAKERASKTEAEDENQDEVTSQDSAIEVETLLD